MISLAVACSKTCGSSSTRISLRWSLWIENATLAILEVVRRNFEVILQDHVAKMACYIKMTDGEVELTLAPFPLALACFWKDVSFIGGSTGRARMVR